MLTPVDGRMGAEIGVHAVDQGAPITLGVVDEVTMVDEIGARQPGRRRVERDRG